jgi:Flp pilus assembly protein TadD
MIMSATVTEPETPAAASPLELEMRRLRDLAKGGQHARALEAAEALAARHPENRDVLHLIAMSQRFLGRIPEALATLERLGQAHPAYSRLHQERGHCHVTLRDAPRAIDAFLRAVNINPALPQSWSMLEGLYRMTGDRDNAATAARHVATLKKLPPGCSRA